jgi:hypothetical protein
MMQQHTLTVSKTGNGVVTSTPAGISCGAACSGLYNAGATVTLTATPSSDYTFDGWSGGNCAGTGTCVITLNANAGVVATFKPRVYTITASAGTGGTISPMGAVSVASGSSQTFTITPSTGYMISNVVVDGVSAGAVAGYYTFNNVAGNHMINATFVAVPNISPSPASYNYGRVKVRFTKSGTLSLYNRGGSPLTVSNVVIEGTDQAMFTITRTSGSKTVAPSGSYSMRVSFRPTSAGAKSAVMRITSNDPDTPALNIPLSGNGY